MDSLFILDKYLFALIDGSGFVIILLLGILKILAKETSWAGDDKIINMLLGMVKKVKVPKIPSKKKVD